VTAADPRASVPDAAPAPAAPPLVSVVIPAHDYGRFVGAAIESVLAQTVRDLEIIVVDDSSADDTREVVGRFGTRARYLFHDGRNPNRTRNLGVRAAAGRFVALLDADDLWLPEKLERQLALFEGRPELGLVYAGIRLFDSESGTTIGYHPLHRCRRGRVLHDLFERQFVPSPTPLIRREVFDRVGFFDEACVAADDWEMWMRIAAQYEFDFVPQDLALYRVHASVAGRKSADAYGLAMLEFFRDCARRYPELAPRLPRRLAEFAEQVGWRELLTGRRAEGRRWLRRALGLGSRSPRLLLRLAASAVVTPSRAARLADAKAAYVQGRHHLTNLRLRDARRHFGRSIRDNPWLDARPYAGLILTFCGVRGIRWLRSRRGWERYVSDGPSPADGVAFDQW